jgi:hypothetical protein
VRQRGAQARDSSEGRFALVVQVARNPSEWIRVVLCLPPLLRMEPTRISTSSTKRISLIRSLICLPLCGALMAGGLEVRAALTESGQTPTEVLHTPQLEAGFHFLYELKFEEARNQFGTWQKSHPKDPLGSAAEAASYLFEECYRQGVLTSEFFVDDKRFLGKIPLKPDPKLRAAFFAVEKHAQDLAQPQLKANPRDANALFAMTLSLLPADDSALPLPPQRPPPRFDRGAKHSIPRFRSCSSRSHRPDKPDQLPVLPRSDPSDCQI